MSLPIAEDIYWVGVNDLKTDLFEELWPLPHGIAYNAYLLCDEKIALIDAVKLDFAEEFLRNIEPLLKNSRKIDYLVINHIEPDHSGAIELLTARFPEMCIVGNERTLGLLKGFYDVPNKLLPVKDRETLNLGRHTLEFHLTPMVHWPETMVTYEQNTQTLFSGDVFGAFGALPKGIFDDEADLPLTLEETRRYFTNVIGKYSSMVLKALDKIQALPLKIIAATHGPVYRKDPARILELYKKWSRHDAEKGVVIVYASMYGHTKQMADVVARSLTENGVKEIKLFDISRTHISFILSEIWRFQGVILGSCTYNTKLFPFMALLLSVLENNHLQNRQLGLFASYSWGGGALAALKSFAEKEAWKVIEPVIEAKCAPSEEVLARCRDLGKHFAEALTAA